MVQISPRDQMFKGDVEHYEWVGRSAVQWIRHSLLTAGKEEAGTILDLPSGYGRVLRRLKVAFPDSPITACDIDREAVDFCAENFGATPAYGSADPSELELGRFDLIWCGSLLTHVAPQNWDAFLSLFARSLNPDGLLVFTTLGRTAADLMRAGDKHGLDETEALLSDFGREGVGFAPFPGRPDYGITLALPSYVASRLDGWLLSTYTEGVWAKHQDVIAALEVPADLHPRPGSTDGGVVEEVD